MKIRTGFVSNSSSSSFMIVGISIEDKNEQVNELYEKLGWKGEEFSGIKIKSHSGPDSYNKYIGFDLSDGSETMILSQMKELFVNYMKSKGIEDVDISNVSIHSECWYDG